MNFIPRHLRHARSDETFDCFDHSSESDSIIAKEVQLILAEKRTSLAAMRTGIAVFALPLSVLGLLIATSRYYNVMHVLPLIVPLGILLTGLIVLGGYLIMRSMGNIHHYDQMILQLKACHGSLSMFLE